VTITAFYRIHSTDAGSVVVNPSATTTLADAPVRCQQGHSSRQIGCLVQNPFTCHVGYAGREAADSVIPNTIVAEPLAIGGVDPNKAGVQSVVTSPASAYPLARRLFYSTLMGFGQDRLLDPNGLDTTYETAQYNLYKCLADQGQEGGAARNLVPEGPGPNPSFAIQEALAKAGFVEVPAVDELPAGPKMCLNMCNGNSDCGTLSAIPSGDLNEL
jgi:hypothetical protein